MNAILVGCGVMGRNHLRAMRAAGIRVAGVVDTVKDSADCRSIEDAPRADIACIATPPSELVEQTSKALALGMDVLVEKPMALSLEEAEGLTVPPDRRLIVGYTERFNPAVIELKRNLHRVGRILHVSAHRLGPPSRSQIPVALDLGTHDLDTLRFLGLEPQVRGAVSGEGEVLVDLQLRQGRATLAASHRHERKIRRLTVTGERGMLALDYQAQTLTFLDEERAEQIPVKRAEPLVNEWHGFLAGEGAKAVDALATLHLAQQIEGKVTA